MLYLYLKALHIIFVVTWFAGLFYMPRLFIYNTEANKKPEIVRNALQEQFTIMMKRLWFGITWPSALLTLVLGLTVMVLSGYHKLLLQPEGSWLLIKLIFVLFLYIYFLIEHRIFLQQSKGIFRYTSQQLRIWNEIATIFLVAIVMLVVVKQNMSAVWGLVGLILFIIVLMSAIKIYKLLRKS
ncbi:protoporphyrinogen IX oxidase [Terrimonas sp.]|uniref:CopD family protein n=1 Tax=Terrimonas sp. TaxID=1914338 RepID=UPI000D507189|nr:CopD family protein [Terrimonas sp.]PVD51155.1 protoporphyrinogen IX oxidase [Terrimonas sp.]